MGLIRRRRPSAADRSEAERAAVAAAEADHQAARALAHQVARAEAEHQDLVKPLRRIRERNHLAEDIAAMLTRGYGEKRQT
jgi:hypothetical protein